MAKTPILLKFEPELLARIDAWNGDPTRTGKVMKLIERGLGRPGAPDTLTPVRFEIDHKDRNPRNNDLSNLKVAPRIRGFTTSGEPLPRERVLAQPPAPKDGGKKR